MKMQKVRFLIIQSLKQSLLNMGNSRCAMLVVIVVMVMLVWKGSGEACKARVELAGVESGVVNLAGLDVKEEYDGQQDGTSTRKYTLVMQRQIPNPSVILSLSSLSTSTSQIIFFDINVSSIAPTEITLSFIFQQDKWTQVSYRYMVTNRFNELSMGMVSLGRDSMSSVGVDSSNLQLKIDMDQKIDGGLQRFKTFAFLKGYWINSKMTKQQQLLSFTVNSARLISQSRLQLNVSLQREESLTLQLLSISYVCFNPERMDFASFGGLIEKANFMGMSKIDVLLMDLPGVLYPFFGITGISAHSSDGLQVISAINEQFFFELSVKEKIDRVAFTYFVFGQRPRAICQGCGDMKILSGDECVAQCAEDEIIYRFEDSALACQKCPYGQIPNSERSQCLKKSYQQQPFVDTIEKSYLKSNKTTTLLDSPQLIIIDEAENLNESLIKSQAFVLEKQKEEPVGEKTALNDVKENNQFMPFTYCQNFPNSYWSGEACRCQVGFVMRDGMCSQIKDQFVSETMATSKSGDLKQPQPLVQENSNHQFQAQNKNDHQYQQQQQPVIKQIETTIEAQIETQSQFQNSIISQNACHSNLETFNYISRRCECLPGLSYMDDPETNSLFCVNCEDYEGHFSQGGYCRYCGSKRIYDSLLQRCRCKDGYLEAESGQCVQIQRQDAGQWVNQINDVGVNFSGNDINLQSNIIESRQPTVHNVEEKPSISYPVVDEWSQQNQQEGILSNKHQMSIALESTDSQQVSPQNDIPQITGRVVVSQPQGHDSFSSVIPQTISNDLKGQGQIEWSVKDPFVVDATQQYSSKQIDQRTVGSDLPAFSSVSTQAATLSQQPTVSQAPAAAPQTCMKLSTTPRINTANIFITLQLSQPIGFSSQEQMQSFMQSQFAQKSYEPSSIYCNQNEEDMRVFECLLLYSSGVSNGRFEVVFWFEHVGMGIGKCELKVNVDTLELAAKSIRARKRS